MPGQLLTHYFLTDGIRETPEWKASVADREAFDSFREGVARRYEALRRSRDPNEAVTEQDLIRPVLDLLGWNDYLPQQGAARNEDIPDHLLFADAASKAQAGARANSQDRYLDALAVEESKRFRPSSRQSRRERPGAARHAARPDTAVFVDRRELLPTGAFAGVF